MTWAAELAWKAGQAMADAVVDQVPQTDRGEFADKLLAIIRRRGTVKVRDIQMCIRGRLRSAEIKDIVRQLIEAGEVECTPTENIGPCDENHCLHVCKCLQSLQTNSLIISYIYIYMFAMFVVFKKRGKKKSLFRGLFRGSLILQTLQTADSTLQT